MITCYPETLAMTRSRPKDCPPTSHGGFRQDPGPAGTTLRLCFQGATREEGLLGLP